MAKRAVQKPLDLKGTKEGDTLVGSSAGEKIKGSHGNDVLVGLGGADTLTGGKGADSFRYLRFEDSRGGRIDHIADFNAAEGDTVDLRALGTATLQASYNAASASLQAVFTYNADTNRTLLSYYQGSATPVFQVEFKGDVRYSPSAFLGIVRPGGPTEGDDNLTGTAGNDTVDLLGGNDSYDGLAGNDTISGGAGNDLLRGGLNDDTIFGGQGDDTIFGGTHGDNLYGGAGADRFVYLEQADSAPFLGPNSGVDRIHDFNPGEGDKIDLTALAPRGFYLGSSFRTDLFETDRGQIIQTDRGDGTYLLRIFLPGDRIEDMHIVLNTRVAASDLLGVVDAPAAAPTEGYDDLIGTAGDDGIDLLGGNDRYDGLAGNDAVNGGSGDDTLLGGAGNDRLHGNSGSDVLTGGAGADQFFYNWGNGVSDVDRITDFNRAEGDKIDIWSSNTGRFATLGWLLVDDAFSAEARASTPAGQIVQAANGDGTYTLTFYNAYRDVPAFKIIVNTKVIPTDFLGDRWVQYPADPTEGADSFVGFHGDDRISLLGGDDSYDGLSGNDQIDGGAGNDTLRAGSPIGTDIGGSGIHGGSGNDLLIAGSGQDHLSGGADADRLFGGAGADQLFGGDGDDTLVGGLGGDYMDGGSGADTYVYTELGDSPVAAATRPVSFPIDFNYSQPDVIFGFEPTAGDVLDLRQLDTNSQAAGVQTAAWTFTGSAYDPSVAGAQMTLTPGTIYTYEVGGPYPRAGTTLSLYLDDGNAVPDFQILLTGSHTTTQGILW